MAHTTTETGTKHAADCKRVFNRYDATCPRCQELAQGAKPREGWNAMYEAMDGGYGVKHDCQQSHCGPICTWGES
jgi:hypothetical protein